ncbi:MAG: hypothetical protein KA711_03885 [Ideonella sp. WA131b]|nr:hypothetical protein [Ideonella sp. WA131b]
MASSLGQPVVVENRPGAGGTIATAAVAAAAADGHTLNVSGCSGDSITHAFVSQGRTPLALFKDLTPVGRLLLDHWLVLVPSSSDVASLSDLAGKAKAAAEPVAYPSPGEGSTPHLQAERLARALGFKSLHVPYKDSPINDLVGGRLAYAVLPSAAAVPLVKSGRLKALAVLSAERLGAWAAEIQPRVGPTSGPRPGAARSPGCAPGPAWQRRMGPEIGPTRRAGAAKAAGGCCAAGAGVKPALRDASTPVALAAPARGWISAAHAPSEYGPPRFGVLRPADVRAGPGAVRQRLGLRAARSRGLGARCRRPTVANGAQPTCHADLFPTPSRALRPSILRRAAPASASLTALIA